MTNYDVMIDNLMYNEWRLSYCKYFTYQEIRL